MLSSCKNKAWERSKCLRHPQPPSPVLGAGACPETPGWTRTLSSSGCGRMGVRGVWGWKSVACFGRFPFGFLFECWAGLSSGSEGCSRSAGTGLW